MRTTLLLLLCLPTLISTAQTDSLPIQNQYLSFQLGGLLENQFNSAGVRIFFEYQKDITRHQQLSLSYEHATHLFDIATDHSNEIQSNLSFLNGNYLYKVFLWKDKIYWTAGLGAGIVHVNWEENNKIGFNLNASMTLNLKITDKITIETAPLLILFPFNRIYYSPLDIGVYQNMYPFTVVPLGIKFKL